MKRQKMAAAGKNSCREPPLDRSAKELAGFAVLCAVFCFLDRRFGFGWAGGAGAGLIRSVLCRDFLEARGFSCLLCKIIAEYVEAKEVGGSRLGAGSGDYADDFAGTHIAAFFEELLGCI